MVIVHAELTITFLIITSFICSSFMLTSRVRRPNTILRMISTSTLQDTAKHLVHSNVKTYVCIAVAGGGGHAISTLASTPGASALFLEGTVTYDRKSLQNYVGETIPEDQKYVSYETASLLSRASLRRAMQYRGHLQDYPHCVGVGITSTLVSTVEHSKNSFGFVVATRADGFQWKCSISLSSKKNTRYEEDILFSDIVLQSLHLVMSNGEKELQLQNPADVLDQTFLPLTPKDEIQAAAERILRGDAQAVLLLPNSNRTFQSVLDPVVPPKSLVFPGSFNPPHIGHTSLAKAASRGEAVIWEISLTNPDKPDIDPLSVSQRAHQFFELEKELPSQWAILLTRAPLFQQKVKALQMYLPRDSQFNFLIGTDTMIRILNPKYYGQSVDTMLKAVRDMGRSGVKFVVGGRLEQLSSGKGTRFITGEEELSGLPQDIQQIFTLMTEEQFRVDVSSTEIRTRREKHE